MAASGAMSLLSLEEFQAARRNIADLAIDTPLVPFQGDEGPGVYLKLECLQSIGSFKVRCAGNAIMRRRAQLRGGVTTASAGNFAQGLAFAGARLGIAVTTYVPETAAQSKVDAVRRLGATVVPVPFAQWWAMLVTPPDDPQFIHPVADRDVLLGNGTIALEILDLIPDVTTVIAPFGGGGLATGIAAALRAAGSAARVVPCETEAGAPLRAALEAGGPVPIYFDPTTFITGMGGPTVLPPMWPLVSTYFTETAMVTLKQTADAVRLLVDRHHVVAEGAGAAPVAAALAEPRDGKTVCIVSGGHLDAHHLITILQGNTP